MRHYFIDLENVRSAGLEGIVSLDESDYVHIFYSDNANSLTIPALESINSSKARVSYTKINTTGSNAMDFQIVAMLGAMIEREKTGDFFVISHDNGFKSAINFCKEFFSDYGLTVGLFASIDSSLKKDALTAEKKPQPEASSRETKSQSDAGQQEKKSQSDAGRRSSRSKKNKNKQAKEEKASENKEAAETAASDDSDPYGYIYSILSKKLSESVLAVYAEGIHEGILNSSTRKEYKKFLYQKYGNDEGEALYNLVQLYFDKMKKSIS